ncbi:MAG: hypothetical protein JEZ11_04645 [Desulfobacterales bacterium]|nr:hypothetical protein [Desulfobacterales bacterium]
MKRNAAVMILTLLALSFFCSLLPGCQGPVVPLTQQVRQEFSSYLPDIQVYVSSEILLVRESESEEKGVIDSGANIRVRKEKTIESITIPSHTPGIIVGGEGDTLQVQFESSAGETGRVLPFSLRLSARADGGPKHAIFIFDLEEIEYDGQRYRVAYEEGSVPVTETDGAVYDAKAGGTSAPTQYIATRLYPYLMIHPVEELARLEKKNRIVKGLRVGKAP